MKPQAEHVYFATMVLQCPHRIISYLVHFGHMNLVVPSRLVMRFLQDMQVSSSLDSDFAFAMGLRGFPVVYKAFAGRGVPNVGDIYSCICNALIDSLPWAAFSAFLMEGEG